MNSIATNHNYQPDYGTSPTQPTIGVLALVFGAAMAAGQPVWPASETPTYAVAQTSSSYSEFAQQVMSVSEQYPHADFAREVASIYTSLSERQTRLGNEFEAAIFDDLDSLYET